MWWFGLWLLSCICNPPSEPTEGVASEEGAARALPELPELPPGAPYALTEGPLPGFPDYRSSGSSLLQLHVRAPDQIVLPDSDPSRFEGVSDSFVLSHEEVPNPRNKPRKLTLLRAPLPFPLDADDKMFRPERMSVRVHGELVPFSRTPAPHATQPTWRIRGRHLVLTYPSIPPTGAVEVTYPGVRAQLDRHDPAASGLSPEKFVRTDLTLGYHTRSGLLMVAPTELRWNVTLPRATASFEAWVAMEPATLRAPSSDGARVRLRVREGDEVTEIGTKRVPSGARAFDRWEADLSRWAGKAVTLELASEPLDTDHFDWVFVGAPIVWGPPEGEVRRVVVVGIDTTRPDHLSFNGYRRPTTPELDAFARSGVVFSQTWAPAPRTRPSFRSATTGRMPLEAVGATNIGEVFRQEGFATAGYVANPHLQPHFGFSRGFDTWLFDGRADAARQVDRALDWLNAHQEHDAYLFLHLMDPHMIYDPPPKYRDLFVEGPEPGLPPRIRRGEVLARMKAGSLTDKQKAHLEALHDGELRYTSAELGRLLDALDRMPGRTLVAILTDHGEEFWEHDGFEHNHTLYDEVTRALLALRPRGGLPQGRTIETPATLADLGPTLFDLFGFAEVPPMDGRSLGPLLAGAEVDWADRPLPLGHVQYAHDRWGVVHRGHKYVLHTGSGREELYDLRTDPAEKQDLAATKALEPFRAKLAEAHHIPVGPGWRIRLQFRESDPFEVGLPAPATRAGILDPEALVERRANVEWGETPRRVPADIGEVSLSDDRTTLSIRPGGARRRWARGG